jgi:hypothetical protein
VPSTGGEHTDRLMVVDREGHAEPLKEGSVMHLPRLSPDGRKIVTTERFGRNYNSSDIVI